MLCFLVFVHWRQCIPKRLYPAAEPKIPNTKRKDKRDPVLWQSDQASVGDDGAIEFTVDARPAHIEQAVGVLEAPEALDPGDLAALIRLLTPPILGKASNFVPDLPVPEIALDEFLSTPATEGKTVRVSDSSVSLEENGWLLVKADIEVY